MLTKRETLGRYAVTRTLRGKYGEVRERAETGELNMLRPPLIGDCESRAEVATVRKYCSRNTCRVYLSKSDHNVRDYPRCGAQRIRTDEISRGIVPRVLHYIAALVSKFDLGINTKNCEGARHHHPAVVAAARASSDCSPSLER